MSDASMRGEEEAPTAENHERLLISYADFIPLFVRLVCSECLHPPRTTGEGAQIPTRLQTLGQGQIISAASGWNPERLTGLSKMGIAKEGSWRQPEGRTPSAPSKRHCCRTGLVAEILQRSIEPEIGSVRLQVSMEPAA